jgi:hypothetical protein
MMDEADRQELIAKFRRKFGTNIMTPDVIGMRVKDNRIVEISSGRGLENQPIYGVTIRDYNYNDRKWKDPDLSKMFYSRKIAEGYAKKALEKVV